MTTLSTRKNRSLLTVAVVAALAVGGTTAFNHHAAVAAAAKAAANQPAPHVLVATVASKEATIWTPFSGRLEAINEVEIRARVSGAVQSVHFKEGGLVKAGDLLVTIDPAPYQAEVDRAQAQVTSAIARASYAKSEYDRAQRLWTGQAIAEKELNEKTDATHEADASLEEARAALTAAKLNLEYTQVRAPISGRVGKIDMTVGNLVAAGPNSPVLTTLVSVDPIYASFDADEGTVTHALSQLPPGTGRTHIDAIPVRMGTADTQDQPYVGELQLIDNQVDGKSGTVHVRAIFKNADASLIPGQFAHMDMGSVHPESVLLVNERAVGTDQNKKFVFVVGADGTTTYREVTLGTSIDGLRVVTTGLKAGDSVIVNGLQHVKPGIKVTTTMVPMNAKSEILADASAAN